MKVNRFFIIAAIAGATLAGCNKDKDGDKNGDKSAGVLINGVTWATSNVGAPGAFAAKPEDAGMFYQWNRNKAWAATGSITGWDNTIPGGTSWTSDNDPSPEGWRVPTKAELEKLLDETKVDIKFDTKGGVQGVYFTDKANSKNKIFLPAAGMRRNDNGNLQFLGDYGDYWSSTAYNLWFIIDGGCAMTDAFNLDGGVFRRSGYSIRPVKK